jgi:hypothetical protein
MTGISFELIRSQADAAAARWATNPTNDKPANPYQLAAFPDAHRAWARFFEAALLRHSAQKTGEGAA